MCCTRTEFTVTFSMNSVKFKCYLNNFRICSHALSVSFYQDGYTTLPSTNWKLARSSAASSVDLEMSGTVKLTKVKDFNYVNALCSASHESYKILQKSSLIPMYYSSDFPFVWKCYNNLVWAGWTLQPHNACGEHWHHSVTGVALPTVLPIILLKYFGNLMMKGF